MDAPSSIYTIGYGGRTFDELVTILRAHGITCLVDVRSIPASRFRPEFARAPLEVALPEHGIRYVFLGDALGGRPEAPDCYVDGKVDYERVREKAFFHRGIERIRRAHAQGIPVVLLCSEGRPEGCHRTKLIGKTLDELGIPVTHLDEQGQPRTQVEIVERLTGGQLNLFGPPSFTSRKRYDGDG